MSLSLSNSQINAINSFLEREIETLEGQDISSIASSSSSKPVQSSPENPFSPERNRVQMEREFSQSSSSKRQGETSEKWPAEPQRNSVNRSNGLSPNGMNFYELQDKISSLEKKLFGVNPNLMKLGTKSQRENEEENKRGPKEQTQERRAMELFDNEVLRKKLKDFSESGASSTPENTEGENSNRKLGENTSGSFSHEKLKGKNEENQKRIEKRLEFKTDAGLFKRKQENEKEIDDKESQESNEASQELENQESHGKCQKQRETAGIYEESSESERKMRKSRVEKQNENENENFQKKSEKELENKTKPKPNDFSSKEGVKESGVPLPNEIRKMFSFSSKSELTASPRISTKPGGPPKFPVGFLKRENPREREREKGPGDKVHGVSRSNSSKQEPKGRSLLLEQQSNKSLERRAGIPLNKRPKSTGKSQTSASSSRSNSPNAMKQREHQSPLPTNKRVEEAEKRNQELMRQLADDRAKIKELSLENQSLNSKIKRADVQLSKFKALEEDYQRLLLSFEKSEVIRNQQKNLIANLQEQISVMTQSNNQETKGDRPKTQENKGRMGQAALSSANSSIKSGLRTSGSLPKKPLRKK